VTDYFELFGERRRPWLQPEVLQEKFLSLSRSVHPDRVHSLSQTERASAQERYVQLNAAHQCLRETRERLRHLLELELGAVPREVRQIPSDLMDLFVEIGKTLRESDAFLLENAGVQSPLLEVRRFEMSQHWTEKLLALQQKVTARREVLVEELKRLDAEWAGSAGQLRQLEETHHLFSYFDRWLGQIRERLVGLSL